jgi:hypothetical protein
MAIITYIDFVNNYLVKNGMVGNATNMNKAPDQLKQEIDLINAAKVEISDYNSMNLNRADKYLAAQNIANMLYTSGDLTKIRYKNDSDVDYEVLNYTSGNLSTIQHYIGSVLKGTTTLTYSGGNLVSAVFVAV